VNCIDGCPDDAGTTATGACGCGTPDTDTDADGTPNCLDECPENPNLTAPSGCGGCGGACGMGMAVATPLTLCALLARKTRRRRQRPAAT
jgi:hypothetical protein